MNMPLIFTLRAELVSTQNNISERNVYQRTYDVKLLRQTGQNATIYDKELKMHFENKAALESFYEVEIVNICVDLCSRLEKASDFICRTGYIYDHIQLKVNSKGKITSIENTGLLRNRWNDLKKYLLKDYEGDAVTSYLGELDDRLAKEGSIWDAVNQYFYFGFLFPHIPMQHSSNWNNRRLIEFSEFEEERFEELISYNNTENGVRNYNVTGETLSESDWAIDEYKGYLLIPENEIFPSDAEIEIAFSQQGVTNRWNFTIYRQ